MVISIIIAHYGNSKYLEDCLLSIEQNTYIPHEVITVNTEKPRISVAEAWNEGIESATGEIVVILNDDTLVSEFWLSRLYWYLQAIDNAMVSTPSTSKCASIIYTELYDKMKPDVKSTADVNRFNKIVSKYYGLSYKKLASHEVTGFCAMFRKKDWELAGKFYKGFKYAYGEENDFFDKLSKKKKGVFVLASGVYVHHFKGKTTERVKDLDLIACKALYERRRHERRKKTT